MTEHEFTLMDRLTKIKSTIEKYGEENFSLSFSGGKDSTALHYMIDEALPNNQIPRVYCNTGIEYTVMVEFVEKMQARDSRIIIIKPNIPIKQMLEKEGYPFKSKEHSSHVASFQRSGYGKWVTRYLNYDGRYGCPEKLRYQFTDDFDIKVSDKCCRYMKEAPLRKWLAKNGKDWAITGIMKSEGGRRTQAHCVTFKKGNNKFNPLLPVSKEFIDWYIESRNIELCPLYCEPYNFDRTGCKGCPLAIYLQDELNVLQTYFPKERAQCESIWKPVYEEYRRLDYRLHDGGQITLQGF